MKEDPWTLGDGLAKRTGHAKYDLEDEKKTHARTGSTTADVRAVDEDKASEQLVFDRTKRTLKVCYRTLVGIRQSLTSSCG